MLSQLPADMAAAIIGDLERPASPVTAAIRHAAPADTPAPRPPPPAPAPPLDVALDAAAGTGGTDAGEGIRPYAEGSGGARQLPAVVVGDGYDAGGAGEAGRRRPSDAYEDEREQELRTMGLRLETAYAQLEEQRQAHEAAIRQVQRRAPQFKLSCGARGGDTPGPGEPICEGGGGHSPGPPHARQWLAAASAAIRCRRNG